MSVGSRLLKIREEADPFSMDIGVITKGDIVKVLEVCGLSLLGLGRLYIYCMVVPLLGLETIHSMPQVRFKEPCDTGRSMIVRCSPAPPIADG